MLLDLLLLADDWQPEPNIGANLGIDIPFSVKLAAIQKSLNFPAAMWLIHLRKLKEYFNSEKCKNPHRYYFRGYFQTTAFKHANATIDAKIIDAEEQVAKESRAVVETRLIASLPKTPTRNHSSSIIKLNNPLAQMLLRGALLASMVMLANAEDAKDEKVDDKQMRWQDYTGLGSILLFHLFFPIFRDMSPQLRKNKYAKHLSSVLLGFITTYAFVESLPRLGFSPIAVAFFSSLAAPNSLLKLTVSFDDFACLLGDIAGIGYSLGWRKSVIIGVFASPVLVKVSEEVLSAKDPRVNEIISETLGMQLKLLQILKGLPLLNKDFSWGLVEKNIYQIMLVAGFTLPIIRDFLKCIGRGKCSSGQELEYTVMESIAIAIDAVLLYQADIQEGYNKAAYFAAFGLLAAYVCYEKYRIYMEDLLSLAEHKARQQKITDRKTEKNKQTKMTRLAEFIQKTFSAIFANMVTVEKDTDGIDFYKIDIPADGNGNVNIKLKVQKKTGDAKDSKKEEDIEMVVPKRELLSEIARVISEKFKEKVEVSILRKKALSITYDGQDGPGFLSAAKELQAAYLKKREDQTKDKTKAEALAKEVSGRAADEKTERERIAKEKAEKEAAARKRVEEETRASLQQKYKAQKPASSKSAAGPIDDESEVEAEAAVNQVSIAPPAKSPEKTPEEIREKRKKEAERIHADSQKLDKKMEAAKKTKKREDKKGDKSAASPSAAAAVQPPASRLRQKPESVWQNPNVLLPPPSNNAASAAAVRPVNSAPAQRLNPDARPFDSKHSKGTTASSNAALPPAQLPPAQLPLTSIQNRPQ